MVRRIVLWLRLSAALLLAACGGNGVDTAPQPPATTTADTTTTVTVEIDSGEVVGVVDAAIPNARSNATSDADLTELSGGHKLSKGDPLSANDVVKTDDDGTVDYTISMASLMCLQNRRTEVTILPSTDLALHVKTTGAGMSCVRSDDSQLAIKAGTDVLIEPEVGQVFVVWVGDEVATVGFDNALGVVTSLTTGESQVVGAGQQTTVVFGESPGEPEVFLPSAEVQADFAVLAGQLTPFDPGLELFGFGDAADRIVVEQTLTAGIIDRFPASPTAVQFLLDLPDFFKTSTGIEIEIVVMESGEMLDSLSSGRIDAVFTLSDTALTRFGSTATPLFAQPGGNEWFMLTNNDNGLASAFEVMVDQAVANGDYGEQYLSTFDVLLDYSIFTFAGG